MIELIIGSHCFVNEEEEKEEEELIIQPDNVIYYNFRRNNDREEYLYVITGINSDKLRGDWYFTFHKDEDSVYLDQVKCLYFAMEVKNHSYVVRTKEYILENEKDVKQIQNVMIMNKNLFIEKKYNDKLMEAVVYNLMSNLPFIPFI